MSRFQLAGVALAVAVAAAVSVGCGARRAAQPLPLRAPAMRAPVFADALRHVRESYVAPERVDPPAMLTRALMAIAEGVGGVEVSDEGGRVALRAGGEGVDIRREDATDLDALAALLDAAAAWVSDRSPETPPARVQAAALHGALHTLDRWSSVVMGGAQSRMLENFRGSIGGIGCRIGRREDAIAVLEVYPGTPAAEAGIRSGDSIVAVDQHHTAGSAVSDVVGRLRGAPGSTVEVSVERGGAPGPLVFRIERRRVTVSTVGSRMLAPDIAYLRISHLAQNSGVIAVRALGGVRDLPGLRGLVVDLRDNSGGSMLAAGQIADQFVDGGVLIETRGADGGPVAGLRHRIEATSGPPGLAHRDVTVVFLVNRGTGSSAELLAAAVARHDRGLLVGERTFGKGVMQKLYALAGDMTLKLTIARSFAAGLPMPDSGLEPDVTIDESQPGTPECFAGSRDEPEKTVASLPAAAGAADPAVSVAVDLIERYRSRSRQRLREAIAGDLCAGQRLKVRG